jgi:protein ImuB
MTSARRYLVVHLPAFRLERCGYGAEDLAALIAEERSATRLVALTPAARRTGLRRGATAAEARALVPELDLLPLDPEGEREDRAAVVRVFETLSDRVAFQWEDALVVEITWTARICRGPLHDRPAGEAAAAQQAVDLAASLGHVARAAVAGDPLAARSVAEWLAPDGGTVVVPQPETARTLAPLPIAALYPDEALRCALQAVGVQTVGQWAALDPAAVAGRYGPEAAQLHRIARGRADAGPGLGPPDPHGERLAVRVAMAGATTTRELGFALPGVLTELCARLAARNLAAVRLRLSLMLEGRADARALLVRVGRPTRSVPKLERLIRARLDRMTVDAPIEELGVEVVEAAPDPGWQPGLADRTEAGEPLPDLIARLTDLLGEEALFAPVLTSSWRPEAAWRAERFPRVGALGSPAPLGRAEAAAVLVGRTDPVAILEQHEHAWPLPRPSRLLSRPERLEVEAAGLRPVRVRLDHRWQAVERASGPERLCGGWWEASPLDRTYWALEIGGRGLWVFRDRTAWWLHGWFD